MREVTHLDPNAKLPPRKDGKDKLDMWSALVIQAGALLEKNAKDEKAETGEAA
jgi:hypothetical protein